jgi:hypothetical protein
MRWLLTWSLVGSLTLMSGCGGSGRPKLVKAVGKVTLDGQPLDGAMVALQFVATDKSKYQRPSTAITDPDGEFIPQTYGKDDGLPVGKYKVGVQKRELVGKLPPNFNEENPDEFNLTYKWITPRAVADPQSSGIEIEVTSSGMKPDVIELKSSPQPEMERTGPQVRANDP